MSRSESYNSELVFKKDLLRLKLLDGGLINSIKIKKLDYFDLSGGKAMS